ncbi:MAG: hypothetical protein A2Y25_05410 [Candidatus Melainabacteria bacterium GWF2_37_15]|nr:MAG: hypothetical protein A2Y25_05410 [Candidatus Melainabacteria bacterium GWF2_37_15]
MSDASCLTQKFLNQRDTCRKKQQALRSLYNYINQLKFHFDLSEKDIDSILRHILRIKNKDNFIKKLWNIIN